jgi:ATP adenylyltransferase/5',5'''-P-1,P-4-tetraphosphate phosphorylase II
VKAAQMTGAHKHISMIAALTSHLAGKDAEARQRLAQAKQADPAISSEVFFASFPFAEHEARETIEKLCETSACDKALRPRYRRKPVPHPRWNCVNAAICLRPKADFRSYTRPHL